MKKPFTLVLVGLGLLGLNAQSKNFTKWADRAAHTIGHQSTSRQAALRTEAEKLKVDSMRTYAKDMDSGIWQSVFSHKFTYDGQGNVLTSNTYAFFEEQRTLSNKIAYTYNAQNKRTVEVYEEYSGTGVLEETTKIENTYDAQGRLVTIIISSAEAAWPLEYISKVVNVYNANGRLDTMLNYEYAENSWLVESKTAYSYDASGNNILQSTYGWIEELEIWSSEVSRTAQTFDNKGQVLSIVESMLNDAGKFQPTRKTDNVWDAYGNNITNIEYVWNEGAYIPVAKMDYAVDLSRSINDIYADLFMKEGFVNAPKAVVYTVPDDENWIVTGKDTVYYSPATVNALEDVQLTQGLYLEEATKTLYEAGANSGPAQVYLHDMQGRAVLAQPLTAGGISLAQLASGMYVYHIQREGKVSNGKILLK